MVQLMMSDIRPTQDKVILPFTLVVFGCLGTMGALDLVVVTQANPVY